MPKAQLQYLTDELNKLREQKLYQKLRVLETEQLPVSRFDGREVINLSSNNYLGLTTHPKLRARALEAIEKYGVGSGAVRTIARHHVDPHGAGGKDRQVQARGSFGGVPVRFHRQRRNGVGHSEPKKTSSFPTSSIMPPSSTAAGSRAPKSRFSRTRTSRRARGILKEIAPRKCRKLLITDGVFSMDGDIAPAAALVELAEKYGCIMMIDDAHSSGVLGRNGRGTVDHYNLHGRVDIQVGTLSKAIGALGGYVCSTRDAIEFPLPSRPAVPLFHFASAVRRRHLHWPPSRCWKRSLNSSTSFGPTPRFFKEGLKKLGFNTGVSETPITPIIVGDAALAHQFSRELFAAGVFALGIGFPTVPDGKARIRTIVTATHTEAELTRALEILESVGKKLNII